MDCTWSLGDRSPLWRKSLDPTPIMHTYDIQMIQLSISDTRRIVQCCIWDWAERSRRHIKFNAADLQTLYLSKMFKEELKDRIYIISSLQEEAKDGDKRMLYEVGKKKWGWKIWLAHQLDCTNSHFWTAHFEFLTSQYGWTACLQRGGTAIKFSAL